MKLANAHKILLILPLAALAFLASPAQADIRFDASVHTPEISVRIGNDGYGGNYRHDTRVRYDERGRISRADRARAARLSWYTGLPAHRMIRMHARGTSWKKIGKRLDIPRRVMVASRNHQKWARFVRHYEAPRRGLRRGMDSWAYGNWDDDDHHDYDRQDYDRNKNKKRKGKKKNGRGR